MSRTYISKSLRKSIEETSKGYCEYCLLPSDFSPSSFTIDHIIPEVLNGLTTFDNLAHSCTSCNRNKYDKISFFDTITQQEVRLYHPRQDKWTDHFSWDEDETSLIGLTSIGRATIELLKLNRENNINQRSLLRLVGLHPPSDYP